MSRKGDAWNTSIRLHVNDPITIQDMKIEDLPDVICRSMFHGIHTTYLTPNSSPPAEYSEEV